MCGKEESFQQQDDADDVSSLQSKEDSGVVLVVMIIFVTAVVFNFGAIGIALAAVLLEWESSSSSLSDGKLCMSSTWDGGDSIFGNVESGADATHCEVVSFAASDGVSWLLCCCCRRRSSRGCRLMGQSRLSKNRMRKLLPFLPRVRKPPSSNDLFMVMG